MRLVSWNINSLQIRAPQIAFYLNKYAIDLIALQELKQAVPNFDEFSTWHCAFHSQKTYNGVALLSRYPLADVQKNIPDFDDDQARLIAATVNGVRIINVYVPNGKALGDEKYCYKLRWLAAFRDYLCQERKRFEKVIVLGDFNIAPADLDLIAESWQEEVFSSKAEREALNALNLRDTFRELHPERRQYSWWDYRLNSFKRNIGMRIDLILANENIDILRADIDPEPRTWERPSDHCPIWLEIK